MHKFDAKYQITVSKNQIKFKAVSDVSIKAEGSDFIIEGYGAIFGNVDSYNDIVEPGAFTKTLNEMRDRICLCYQHDIHMPIGKMMEMHEDNKGLYFKARISDAEEGIKQKIKEGILKEFSIGYSTIKYEMEEKGEGMRPICHLKEVKLWEISLVTIAANDKAGLLSFSGKSEWSKDILIEEFDRIIAIERDQNKKFELLKLKALFEAQPEQSTKLEEPQNDLTADEINYFEKRISLI